MSKSNKNYQLKPADLRGILEYVPIFRDHIFVVALDGSIIAHENFANVLTDIAVLRSLNIHIIIVHGIGQQLIHLAESKGLAISNAYGEGPTDEQTLALAIEASGIVSQTVMAGLSQNNIKCAICNAIRATDIGILQGRNQLRNGKVEKINVPFLQCLLEKDIVPIIQPIVNDRDGATLRANSDALAAEVALAIEASKLIYLTSQTGLTINGQMAMNIPLDQLNKILQKTPKAIEERLRSKAECAAKALREGTPRAHILDGRIFGGLLTEIFDKVGLGTMIHANEYQQIRPARKKDIQPVFNIIKNAARQETLRHRTRQNIEKDILNFFVYEVDGSIIGCASLIPQGKSKTAELASVLVQGFYQGKGVGLKLVDYTLLQAKAKGYKKIIALSTQAATFFLSTCGFTAGKIGDLPQNMQSRYQSSGRNSKILIKRL